MQIKVGGIYKVKKGHETECVGYMSVNGHHIKIIKIEHGVIVYFILNAEKEYVDRCSCFNSQDLEPLEKTWDNLEVNDVLVNTDRESKVLAVLGDVFLRSIDNDFDMAAWWVTKKTMQNEGWKIKGEEVKEKEYSMDEVAKALGVDVKDLKIKKD